MCHVSPTQRRSPSRTPPARRSSMKATTPTSCAMWPAHLRPPSFGSIRAPRSKSPKTVSRSKIKKCSNARAIFSPPACLVPSHSPDSLSSHLTFLPMPSANSCLSINSPHSSSSPSPPAHHLWTKPCIFSWGEVLDLIDDAWTWKLYFQPSEKWLLSVEKNVWGQIGF